MKGICHVKKPCILTNEDEHFPKNITQYDFDHSLFNSITVAEFIQTQR